MFGELMTDTLVLHKPDGRAFPGVRACVSSKGILIPDVLLPIEAGDKLKRALPNGSPTRSSSTILGSTKSSARSRLTFKSNFIEQDPRKLRRPRKAMHYAS